MNIFHIVFFWHGEFQKSDRASPVSSRKTEHILPENLDRDGKSSSFVDPRTFLNCSSFRSFFTNFQAFRFSRAQIIII